MIVKNSILNGAKCSSTNGFQNYLVFDLMKRRVADGFLGEIYTDDNNEDTSWDSKGLSQEKIINP